MNDYFITNRNPSCVWVNNIEERVDGSYYESKSLLDIKKIKEFKRVAKMCEYFDVSKLSGFEYTDYFTNENLKEGNIIALTSQNIQEQKIDFKNVIKIPIEIHNLLSRSKIEGEDILLSYTGQYRRACVAPTNLELHLGPNICRLRAKKNIDVYFISTFLNSSYGQSILDREKTMSAQPTVNMSRIREINIPIPTREIQKYIGDKVRKAEELREESKRLKKEAECILSENLNLNSLDLNMKKNRDKFHWINSDILTDRIESDYYKEEFVITIQHLKNSTSKYEVFKNMVEEIYTGKKPIESNDGSEVYFLQSGNISSNFLELNYKVIVDIEKYKKIEDGNLLMAKDGETIGKLAVNYTGKNIILNEHTYCLKFKEQYKNYGAYIYYLFTNPNINALIRREATGSAQKGLSQQFLENIFIPDLEEQVINHFKVIEKKRCSCIYQSKSLVEEAKKDIEDLIEGTFDMSKIKETN